MSNITGLSHLRFPHPQHGVSPFGGITVGYDLSPNEDGTFTLQTAVAQCHMSDNYSRKVGRKIVEGRLNIVKAGKNHRQVSVSILDADFFGGTMPELKQTSAGVYYIPKDQFDLHQIIMRSVVQEVVQARAAQHPFGQFMIGGIVQQGGYTLLVVDFNREAMQQLSQEQLIQQATAQVPPPPAE